jgi:LPS export ABC transporter protein LptC
LKSSPSRFPVISFAFLLLLIAGCNKTEEIGAVSPRVENAPMMTARNIDVLFSDSGHIQARLTALLMNRYAGDEPYMDFPKGFKIQIFDSAMQITSTIEGDRGKQMDKSRRMEANGHVVVRNEIKKEQLNTEHLVWDEVRRVIYSDVKIRITTPGKVLFGDGIESNESFSRYTILNPTGQMMVKKDSI